VKKEKPEKKEEKKEKKESEPAVRTFTPAERKLMLIYGIKKTIVPAFIGAFFALLFFLKFGDATTVSYILVLLLVVLSSFYIQRFVYPLIGVKVEEFETKDWIYVEFFTIVFLIVIWILLLNTGTLDLTVSPNRITTGVPDDVIARVSSSGTVMAQASVNLTGHGVDMSNITGKDGLAYFHRVKATSPGNITVSARIKGYSSGYTNITST
jgi:hypothetical protein